MQIVDIDNTTVDGDIPRHAGHGAPKIWPEGADPTPILEWVKNGRDPKKVPAGGSFYTRTTTFIDALDDKKNIYDWKTRMTIEGFRRDPSLMTRYEEIEDPMGGEKWRVNKLAEEARIIADSDVRAQEGNALHELTEAWHNTGKLPPYPPEYEEDIDSYILATAGMDMLGVEVFVVNDDLKYAGTADRFIRVYDELAEALGVEDGAIVVGDLKTGGSVKWARGKFPMQMAAYAKAKRYDPLTFKRTLTFPELDDKVGLLIHTPVGEGETTLYRMDLERGWQDVLLADEVRKYRKFWNAKASEFPIVRHVTV